MIYICAGMKRSGSTWVYNAVRSILQRAQAPDLAAGWIADQDQLLKHQTVILKTHVYDAALATRADVTLISHRDLRDVAASLHRKFNVALSTEGVRETFNDYMNWKKGAAYDLRYEQLLVDRIPELRKIASVLKLPAVTVTTLDFTAIDREIAAEKFNEDRSQGQTYDSVNLLHTGHITDGKHGSWKNTLSPELVAAVEREFREWMVAEGYLASVN